MKKSLLVLIILAFSSAVYAEDAAYLRLSISGATHDNRYFFCEPSIGCLSVLAGARGKVFPIFQPIELQRAHLSNLETFRVINQPLPASCRQRAEPGHTLTVYGHLQPTNKGTYISGLHCTVR